ncbi:WD repeat-containing protein 54 isoform X4 [Erythrolamprus reginae]|uniref:WD repeat-containing protein 54 isoform X4 n=1 Tax=Erythrolamprus reginae TaxID=121349 RepID=UPI00396CBF3E
MYRRARGLALRGSSLALYNNLAVLPLPAKRLTYFASVHGASVGLLSAAADGTGCAHRQLQAREGGLGPPLVTQAAWCALPSRTLLVLASWKGIQMYEPDGSAMVYWHALDGMEASAGTSTGSVLVFDVPAKGTNITLSEVLEQHGSPITDIGAELCEQPEGAADLVTADDSGALCVWGSGEAFRLITKIPAFGCSCSSVKLWNGIIAAGYGNGQICLYEAAHGTQRAQVSAHARWIYALDLAPLSGKLLSAAEDSFVRVWGLSHRVDTDSLEIEHCHTECVTDTQICGARFCNPEGTAFAVAGFELNEIILYHQV